MGRDRMNLKRKGFILLILANIICCLMGCKNGKFNIGNETKDYTEIVVIYHENFIHKWAQAFCARNEDFVGYKILEVQPAKATILYYVNDTDSHMVVWKQEITFYEENGEYTVINNDLHDCEAIAGGEYFYEAYPEGIINGTPMDYMENGLGKSLNEWAKNSEEGSVLYEPTTAVRYILNLTWSEDALEILTNTDEETGVVQMSMRFESADGNSFAYVQMIQPFGKDGIWVPQTIDGEFEFDKKMIRVYSADLDHDGDMEYINVSYNGVDQDEGIDIEDLIAREGRIGQVEVLNQEDEQQLYEMIFASTRTGNGQLLLVHKDGKSYLLRSDINEQMGEAGYSYEVFYFENGTKKIVDEYSVSFAYDEEAMNRNKEDGRLYFLRQDVVSEFKAHIKEWFDDAFIIVATDINNPQSKWAIISDAGTRYEPAKYYDYVWSRDTEFPDTFMYDIREDDYVSCITMKQIDGVKYEKVADDESVTCGIKLTFTDEANYLYYYRTGLKKINPFTGNEKSLEAIEINGKELVLGTENGRVIGNYDISTGYAIVFNLSEKFWNTNQYIIKFLIETANLQNDIMIKNYNR